MCGRDVVAVSLWFLRHPGRCGIFNVGSGRSQPFNDVAHVTINAMHVERGEAALALAEQVASGLIEYTAFPEAFIGKYQCRTEADLTALCASGCDNAFAEVESGVRRYAEWLEGQGRSIGRSVTCGSGFL